MNKLSSRNLASKYWQGGNNRFSRDNFTNCYNCNKTISRSVTSRLYFSISEFKFNTILSIEDTLSI